MLTTFTPSVTWETAIAGWERASRARGHSPATIRTRREWLNVIAAQAGDRAPATITTNDLLQIMGARDTATPATLHGIRDAARSFTHWAQLAGIRVDDPGGLLPPVRLPRRRPRPCPDHVIRQALTDAPPRIALAIRLAAEAGTRRAEAAALTASQLDADAETLRIIGKGGHARDVPVSTELAAAIELAADPRTGTVFPSRKGGTIVPNTLGHQVSKSLGGIWTMHTLRHRYATALLAAGADIITVRDLLGHASVATTQTYAAAPGPAARQAAHAIRLSA